MGIRTDIPYCDSTVNPMMGCDGCELWSPRIGNKHCYSGVMTERYAGRKGWPVEFGAPALFPERVAKAVGWSDLTGKKRRSSPWLDGYPRVIFWNDMGDPFTESLPLDWMAPHVEAMATAPHINLILTKRPSRMVEFFNKIGLVPDNFWLGTSVTSNATVTRVAQLLELRLMAKVLWVSAEPLVERLSPSSWRFLQEIDWLVVGGESGYNRRPFETDWARETMSYAGVHDVSFFMKQIDKVRQIPPDLMIRHMPPANVIKQAGFELGEA